MTQNTWFVIAIVAYLALMLGIGWWSYRNTKKYDDYMLAGRNLGPFVAALSAGASDMSGWLLMGLPGALFVTGASGLWIAIGLLIGCWANWKWIAPRLRAYTEVAGNSITLPSFFERRIRDDKHLLRMLSSLVIIVFFTFYVSSGMVAGGKYFESTFGGDYLTGMVIIGAVTVLYTFVGGFLAVSLTDAVQGMLMFFALLIVPIAAALYLNDPASMFTWANHHDYGPYTDGVGNPHFFSMIHGVTFAGVIGAMAWGLGYFGQPHIIVRFMALRSPAEAKSGRRIGVAWMFICIAGAAATALVATAFFGQTGFSVTDQESFETIFLDMGRILFHPLISGLILTAVLAAIMSTMSSQLLVSSSALIEDLYRVVAKKQISDRRLMIASRGAVIGVALVAMALAVHPSDSILALVGFAWAGFGSAFGPLVVACLWWPRLTKQGAMAGLVVGAVVSFLWGQIPALHAAMYEIVPGFLCSAVALVVVSLLTAKDDDSTQATIREEFQAASLRART